MKPSAVAWSFACALAAVVAGAGCTTAPPPPNHTSEAPPPRPTLRLFVLSTLAGGLEPCGCTKTQLGGVDKLAAHLVAQRAGAAKGMLVAAGPLWFVDPAIKPERKVQDGAKADALADALREMSLVAWAPGANDWAAGAAEFERLAKKSGAKPLAANVQAPALAASTLETAGWLKVGILGLSDPKTQVGKYPDGVTVSGDVLAAARREIASLRQQGAHVLVALAALPRGEALRLADELPELGVLVLGKPAAAGEINDHQADPMLVGSTLVVEAANHAQTVSVVDIYAVEGDKAPLVLADTGVARAVAIANLARRENTLDAQIDNWERSGSVDPKDLAARKQEQKALAAERKALEAEVPPAPAQSFFRYGFAEVKESMGREPHVRERLVAYYRQVNEHNKAAFAGSLPPAVMQGEAGYLGVEACSSCHPGARRVWDGTPHAQAYVTLQTEFKEYNLDCVSCHVTGYGRPGGSTVTVNDTLRGVQCEECHGPGSLHAARPDKERLITRSPDLGRCAASCHHPPHVAEFDPKLMVDRILGPGHGK
ncbi:MAG: hypothetical protein HY908_09205 [Myxococcales bacterium]|nr:hypothetical protein [Myxococcales bacterium]